MKRKFKNILNLGKNVLISAHGNSLRALCKYLFKISDEKINELEIPTGNPLIIEFDKSKNQKYHYLDEIELKILFLINEIKLDILSYILFVFK